MSKHYCGPNFEIPPGWIIEEEEKREREKQKRERPLEPLPISLPELEYEDPTFMPHKEPPPQERVVVVDI